MRTLAIAFLFGFFAHSSVQAQGRHKVLPQDGSPVTVVAYDAEFWGTGSGMGDGVNHDLRFRNDSERGVVAVKFGFLCYDVFNDFQDEAEEIVIRDLSPGDTTRYSFRSFPPAPASFYTGFIYVRKVRFLDGEVWEVTPEELNAMIQAFETQLMRAGEG